MAPLEDWCGYAPVLMFLPGKAFATAFLRRIRGGFWFWPAVYMLGGFALSMALVAWGDEIPLPPSWRAFLARAGQEGVRTMLETLVAGSISVTAVSFSVLVVVLNLAAANFSPRALRGVMSDSIIQHVLGVFFGVFVFAVWSLALLPLDVPGRPNAGVILLTAVIVGTAELATFVTFVHHLATRFQVTTLLKNLHAEANWSITAFLPAAEEPEDDADEERPKLPSALPGNVTAKTASYVQVLDRDSLLRLACRHDLMIRVLRREGHFVNRGHVLAEVWPSARLTPKIESSIRDAYAFGTSRNPESDPALGIEIIAEVGVRALSTGINDPHTAVNALHYLGDLMIVATKRRMPQRIFSDEDGRVRVVLETTTFRGLLERAFLDIARNGADKPIVIETILDELGEILGMTSLPGRRRDTAELAQDVVKLARPGLILARERERIERAMRRIETVSRATRDAQPQHPLE